MEANEDQALSGFPTEDYTNSASEQEDPLTEFERLKNEVKSSLRELNKKLNEIRKGFMELPDGQDVKNISGIQTMTKEIDAFIGKVDKNFNKIQAKESKKR
jgi:hypothetical protein